MIRVEVSDRVKAPRADAPALVRLARRVLAAEGVREGWISLALLDDREMHRVNLAHLRHDYPTDVLSFRLSEGAAPLEGEVLVGVERAIENAAAYGRTVDEEIRLYVVHGLLHLVGYDDKRPADARRMSRRQEELLGVDEEGGEGGRATSRGRRGARRRAVRARGVEKP